MIILSIIDCCYKCVNGCTDDVRVDAGTPGKGSVWFLNSHIGNRFGTGALLKRMLLIGNQVKFQFIRFLKCIADSIQTTITSCFCGDCRSIKSRGYLSNNSSVFLLEMNLIDAVRTWT